MTSNYVSVNLQLLYTHSNSSNLTNIQDHDVKHVEVWILAMNLRLIF